MANDGPKLKVSGIGVGGGSGALIRKPCQGGIKSTWA
jgi:hypothetical protein